MPGADLLYAAQYRKLIRIWRLTSALLYDTMHSNNPSILL